MSRLSQDGAAYRTVHSSTSAYDDDDPSSDIRINPHDMSASYESSSSGRGGDATTSFENMCYGANVTTKNHVPEAQLVLDEWKDL